VAEFSWGPLRWFGFAPSSIDLVALALAVIAAGLVFVRHLGMVATVAIMAALGIAARFAFGG
jgi:hypothetical protein